MPTLGEKWKKMEEGGNFSFRVFRMKRLYVKTSTGFDKLKTCIEVMDQSSQTFFEISFSKVNIRMNLRKNCWK